MLRGAFVATGAELLTPYQWDSNSLWLTERWYGLGIAMTHKCVVGDRVPDIASAVGEAMRKSDVVAVCGGLGPTRDDRTVGAVAQALGRPLVIDRSIEKHLQTFRKKHPLSKEFLKQARKPRGFEAIPNAWGSAPALWGRVRNRLIFILPGVPLEFKNLYEAHINQRLKRSVPRGRKVEHHLLRVEEFSEPWVDEQLQSLTLNSGTDLGVTVVPGTIDVHLMAEGRGGLLASRLKRDARSVRERLGEIVYAEAPVSAAQVLGALCQDKKIKLACAESCTGGMVAQKITSVPGCSDYFSGGVVCYSNREKENWLGVSKALLKKHGAVSEPVARAMVQGVVKRTKADLAVSVTGIAGPAGGTKLKPVGTVCFGVCFRGDTQVLTRRFYGDRESVRIRASEAALHLMRRALLAEEPK